MALSPRMEAKAEPRFSQPVRQIVMMLIALGLAVALGVLLYREVMPVFLASPWLNGFIVFVFVLLV